MKTDSEIGRVEGIAVVVVIALYVMLGWGLHLTFGGCVQ